MPKETIQVWFDKKYSNKTQKITKMSEKDFDAKTRLDSSYLRIEDFIKLGKISLGRHELTSLGIIDCPELTWIDLTNFFSSPLTKLKIENCPELVNIEFDSGNNCSTDKIGLFISRCPKLSRLICRHKNLTKLEIVNCPNLVDLDCSFNSIKNLDLNTCSKITKIDCSSNELDNLDVSNCPDLVEIKCHHNKLTSIYVNSKAVNVYPEDILVNYKGESKLEADKLKTEINNLKKELEEIKNINMLNTVKEINKKLKEEIQELKKTILEKDAELKSIKKTESEKINESVSNLESKLEDLEKVKTFLDTKGGEIERSFEIVSEDEDKYLLKLGEENKEDLGGEGKSIDAEIKEYKNHKETVEKTIEKVRELVAKVEITPKS